MDNKIIQEIEIVKNELKKEKINLSNIKELIKKDINKMKHFSINHLSPSEINLKMNFSIKDLSNYYIQKPDLNLISSHRKYIGRTIVLLKKIFFKLLAPYSNYILENQEKINDNFAHILNFNNLILLRLNEIESNQKKLEKKVSDSEDKLTLLSDKMDQI